MDLIKALNKEQLEKEVPQVQVGDTVRVHVKVKEGARERIQVFEGTVIAKKHGGRGKGVPRALPLHRHHRSGPPRLRAPRQAVLSA